MMEGSRVDNGKISKGSLRFTCQIRSIGTIPDKVRVGFKLGLNKPILIDDSVFTRDIKHIPGYEREDDLIITSYLFELSTEDRMYIDKILLYNENVDYKYRDGMVNDYLLKTIKEVVITNPNIYDELIKHLLGVYQYLGVWSYHGCE